MFLWLLMPSLLMGGVLPPLVPRAESRGYLGMGEASKLEKEKVKFTLTHQIYLKVYRVDGVDVAQETERD